MIVEFLECSVSLVFLQEREGKFCYYHVSVFILPSSCCWLCAGSWTFPSSEYSTFFSALCPSASQFCWWSNSKEGSIVLQFTPGFHEEGRGEGGLRSLRSQEWVCQCDRTSNEIAQVFTTNNHLCCLTASEAEVWELLAWSPTSNYHTEVISLPGVWCGHQLTCMQVFG